MATPRLLVVDDHPDTLRLFQTFLSLAGFDVVAFTRAIDALDALGGIDAVATDLAMPNMDGFELIRRIRTVLGDRPVPIVAITGQSIDPATVSSTALGCCRLMLKPCDLGELSATLHFLIEHCAHDCERCVCR